MVDPTNSLGRGRASRPSWRERDPRSSHLQSGRPLDLDHEKIGSGARHSFHRLRGLGATIPCDDWHRSLDSRRCTQDRHWRLDCARRYRLRGVAWKVRLDRASGGGRRVEVAIVYKLIKFSTILGNAQTL